jgi:hypothetical protein
MLSLCAERVPGFRASESSGSLLVQIGRLSHQVAAAHRAYVAALEDAAALQPVLQETMAKIQGVEAKIATLEEHRKVGFAEGIALRRLREAKADLSLQRTALMDQVCDACTGLRAPEYDIASLYIVSRECACARRPGLPQACRSG